MTITLRITEATYGRLRPHHLDPSVPHERISFLFGRAVYEGDELRSVLVAEPPILPADDCYLSQSGGHLALDPTVMNSILARFARSDADVFINVHDHWFCQSGTHFSSIDSRDERAMGQYLRERFEPMLVRRPDIGKPRQIISLALVLDQTGLAARYVDAAGEFHPIHRVEIVGPIAHRIIPNGLRRPVQALPERLLRHRDIVTPEQQAYIADTTFAIVGCGGLGSIAAEELYRIGARSFVLFDPDELEPHNLNRWQGGQPRDVGANKAQLLARKLSALSGGRAKATPIALSALSPVALRHLARADVLIGCTDNHLARYFLNRFSVQYLMPWFDAGVNIRTGNTVELESRYFAVIPGYTACAECTAYQLIDREEVDRALTDDVTSRAREQAGYVQERPEIIAAASAYPLNQRAMSTLTMELMNWVCGYRPFATTVAEYWAAGRFQRSDRDNHPERPDPSCPVCGQLLGVGDNAELPRPRSANRTAEIFEEARRAS